MSKTICTWPACKSSGCVECSEAVEFHDEEDAADYDDEERGPPAFGCCMPGKCCMPGLHFPSECHTASDYERAQFGGWASESGPAKATDGPFTTRAAVAIGEAMKP